MKRHALIFPGQGSQHPGMLESVPETEALEPLLDGAEALSGMALRRILRDGVPNDLADTRVAQPLLYLADWAWGTVALERGLRPAALAGHSLGEFAALAVAGVFTVEAGLGLVVERARLMAASASTGEGGMAAVLGGERDVVRDIVDGIPNVWVANDNSPGQLVVSGTHAGLEAATEALMGAGVRKVVPLSVAGPFHSPLMRPAQEAFSKLLDATSFEDARIPVLQNTDPSPTLRGEEIRSRLREQMTSAVRWTDTMESLSKMGVRVVVECGPGSVLSGLARRYEPLAAVSLDDAGFGRAMEVLG